jgi:hypothetical protein
VYRGILHELRNNGYHVAAAVREKDGLMRFLTAGADLWVTIQTFGARQVFFPEFRDESYDSTPTGADRRKREQ